MQLGEKQSHAILCIHGAYATEACDSVRCHSRASSVDDPRRAGGVVLAEVPRWCGPPPPTRSLPWLWNLPGR
jgi:hypothetical protein